MLDGQKINLMKSWINLEILGLGGLKMVIG